MRPRVFPAEDASVYEGAGPGHRASMRPRVFPAEDGSGSAGVAALALASMRPRVFPAEDLGPGRPGQLRLPGFNEAAGIPRGRRATAEAIRRESRACFNEAAGIPRGRRLRPAGQRRVRPPASMRPRVFPAEDVRFNAMVESATVLQ